MVDIINHQYTHLMFQTPSKCAHCQSVRFELSLEEPGSSAYKLYFVRCAGCKNPIGVLPYYDTNTKIENMEKQIAQQNSTISSNLATIDQNIRTLFQILKR